VSPSTVKHCFKLLSFFYIYMYIILGLLSLILATTSDRLSLDTLECSPYTGNCRIFLNCDTLLIIDERSAVPGPLCVGTLQNMGLCPPRWRYCDCCVLPLPARIFLNRGTLLSIDKRSAVSNPLCVCILQNTGICPPFWRYCSWYCCLAQPGRTILRQCHPAQY